MGLDWMLEQRKAKPGMSGDFLRLMDELVEADEGTNAIKRIQLELDKVSIHACQEIGCPQIGIDQAATDWWEHNVYKPNLENAKLQAEQASEPDDQANEFEKSKYEQSKTRMEYWQRPYEEVLADAKGKYVPDLARTKKGHGKITGMLCWDLDFRGKVLRFIEGLDTELVDEAYNDHSADECIDYANRLAAGREHVRGGDDLDTLEAAIQWLRFWGQRGFGYHAWY